MPDLLRLVAKLRVVNLGNLPVTASCHSAAKQIGASAHFVQKVIDAPKKSAILDRAA
jgi:hypothetical protein